MSSSSSDSDDFEPIRKIKINIRPKEERAGTADVSQIKASVEAWRPLGLPPHSSLSRRQSSLSSVSSASFGGWSAHGSSFAASASSSVPSGQTRAIIHSSPSCSSLVNEFSNRSSFSNLVPKSSRTSSPLAVVNHGDTVPLAIAIQESIELIVKGHYDPNSIEPKYHTRSLGNIKVAFSNAFARRNNSPQLTLKLCLHSTENIIRYYASGLIKDLDSKNHSLTESTDVFDPFNNENKLNMTGNNGAHSDSSTVVDETDAQSNSKTIEFDMEALLNHLKRAYEKSPASRYYNVDILRYQILPISSIEECPLQVCAYWKVEPKLVKLRIDFKHSSKSRLSLERLREVIFTVDLSEFIPLGVDVSSLSPDFIKTMKLNNNNNNSGAMNMNDSRILLSLIDDNGFYNQPNITDLRGDEQTMSISQQMPPQQPAINNISTQLDDLFGASSAVHPEVSYNNLSNAPRPALEESNIHSQTKPPCNNSIPPYITYEPQAHWNNSIKQLSWRFDTLLPYHKTDGLGSLFAKLDFRNYHETPEGFLKNCKPTSVDVKFLVMDSTLSKMNISIDSNGYRMSMLKKEVRSGRYRSEPYIL